MEERGWEVFASEDDEPDKDSEVFFNPEMRLNRDVSEVAGRVFRQKIDVEDFRVCDALSASGIRGFRYSDYADTLHLNDINPEAVRRLNKGLRSNYIEAETFNQDANTHLSKHRNFYTFIDVDPFGSFTRFLDSTARAANHQSFVGLTATDNGPVSGSYPKVCRRRYGSKPLRNSLMHETGLRIYIKEVFRNFARFDKCFDPKICFQHRHYSRLMGRVTESKSRCNKNLENIGYMTFCSDCRWRALERRSQCEYCSSSNVTYAGPLWTGSIGDQRFISDMIDEIPGDWSEALRLLEKLNDEVQVRTPFYDIHKMASEVDVQAPKTSDTVDRLEEKGYIVSETHFEPTGVRTDAPFEEVRNVIKSESTS